MALAQWPLLLAVLLLFSELHCSSPPPPCPESCTCQSASLVNCSSSSLSLVPRHIQDSVTELDLSHNLLNSATLLQAHRNLKNVWLGNNTITHLSLCIVRHLGSQYIRDKHIRHSKPWIRRGCVSWAPTLQLLSVEINQLEQLPEGLEGSKSLQVLQLSFNRISTLRPGDLRNLPQLKELHLQHNLITSLPPQMFQDLAQLRVLDLSFNMLKSLHSLVYLSLRNIGAEVRLDGNKWYCDCSMRSLRRRMSYDNSRDLQTWRVLCASPSILSGKDLLQLEENDLNCLSTENMALLHQDVTVNSGSEVLLSCATQDSVWWTPRDQAFVSEPQIISDITERDTGLYVCVSEDHRVVSVFNLQISKIGGTRRNTRSLSSNQQRTPQETNQEPNSNQSNLALAVCLSVFITFLIAFILGVLARPCIDILWKRVTNKKRSSDTNSGSCEEQRQYDNEAYSSGEEPGELPIHRERRVTFSTVDTREVNNIHYYDTVAGGSQKSINNGVAIECEVAVEKMHTAKDSGIENILRHSTPEDKKTNGKKDPSVVIKDSHANNMEFEHIPDPVELEERSLSSCSDSSVSDKVFKSRTITESVQLAKDSVQQRSDLSTATNVEVPQISIEGTNEIPAFTSEPFAEWSPHTKNNSLKDFELWQENEEQFEFSDSVRTTSARSSIVFDSFNDVVLTSDTLRRDNTSSSSSYVSEDEPTQYTVNADLEEEKNIERSPENDYRFDIQRPPVGTELSSSSDSSDSDYKPINSRVKKGEGKDKYTSEYDKQINKPDQAERVTKDKSLSLSSNSSCSSDSEDETTHRKDRPGMMNIAGLPFQKSPTVSHNSEDVFPAVDLEHIPKIEKLLDIKAPLLGSDSSSSSDSENETSGYTEKQRPGKVSAPYQESQTATCDPDKWPNLDLEHIPHIKRCLDIKAPSLPSHSSSSSDSEDGATNRLPDEISQPVNHEPETRWPVLDLDHARRIKRRLDIKAPSPDSDSSSSSDTEDEITSHTGKQSPAKLDIPELPMNAQDARWPTLNIECLPHLKRRLDIKAPSANSDSSSSSGSEDEATTSIKKQDQEGTHMERFPVEISQIIRHEPETRWPVLDLDHATHIKRRLDIKAPSPYSDSSSSSDSEDESSTSIKRQGQGEIQMEKLPVEISQIVNHEPETRWPVLDLDHARRIKKRLDIKATPDSDSSSSSDTEDEITSHTGKQSPAKLDIPELPMNEQDARWPTLNFECLPHLKRRLDIKAPSANSDSSSSSDSEDEATTSIKKQDQEGTHMERFPVEISQIIRHEPETRWPVLDLDHATHIKRRLDIKAPSPYSDSSSCDSEDESSTSIKRQGKGGIQMEKLPVEISQIVNHEPETRWPVLDLTTRIKRRLDIKTLSPDPDSSSSSDSEDQTETLRPPIKMDISEPPLNDQDARWPSLDFEHIPHIKRRLDIKAPSEDSRFSSSRGCENEIIHPTVIPEKESMVELPLQKSQTILVSERQWPAVDLGNLTHIKRRLDVNGPLAPHASLLSGESKSHTVKQNRDEANKMSPYYSSSSSEESMEILSKPPIKVMPDPDPQWPELDLSRATNVKRHLDIKAHKPSLGTSTSSDSDGETANLKVERDRSDNKDVGITKKEQQTALDKQKLAIPHINRRLNIKTPPPPDLVLSSVAVGSREDDKTKEKEFIKSSPLIKNSSGPKKYPDITLDKYTVITDSSSSISANDNRNTTPEINPELHSRWATMNLGISRFRKRLEITSRAHPSSISSENECKRWRANSHLPMDTDKEASQIGSQRKDSVELKSETSSVVVGSDSVWPQLNLTNIPTVKRALDIRAPFQAELSSSSNSEDEMIHHNVPDLSFGVPRVKRHLNIKAPSPEQSDSPSSSSEDKNKVKRSTTKASRHVPNVPEMTDNESLITYKRLIMKAPSLLSESQTTHQDEVDTVAQERPSYRPSINFDGVVKKRINHSKSRTSGDLPPEIRWTGISRHLSDLSVSSSRKNLGVDSYPQQATAVTTFDNSTGSTNEALSEEKRKTKGLTALKIMSSERRRWDTDEALDHGPQHETSFSYRRSDEDIEVLTKPPLKQLHLSSILSNERRAGDLLYGIPLYRGHASGDIEPPQEAPPPVPATFPPDEPVELSWGSSQRSKTTRYVEESLLMPPNLALYLDSSKTNISDI